MLEAAPTKISILRHLSQGCITASLSASEFLLPLQDASQELPRKVCVGTCTKSTSHIPQKLMLRNHSSALTLVSSHAPLIETCCTSCSHTWLPCFHQSAGNCSPCSCDPVYHPFTTTPAEDVTKVCQHDRQEEEWQKDMTGGGLFCQERNYCKATHLSVCRMGVRQKI